MILIQIHQYIRKPLIILPFPAKTPLQLAQIMLFDEENFRNMNNALAFRPPDPSDRQERFFQLLPYQYSMPGRI